jgi:glutamate synthase domain-containing protein 1
LTFQIFFLAGKIIAKHNKVIQSKLPQALADFFLKKNKEIPKTLTVSEGEQVLKLMKIFADSTFQGRKDIIRERVNYLRQEKTMEKAAQIAREIAKAASNVIVVDSESSDEW